jgi:hypothetical protein
MVALIWTASCCEQTGTVRFEKEVYDFGVAEEGENIHYTYVFKNTGTEPVTIRHVQSSCVCLPVLGYDRIVAPGKKGKIPVAFTAPRFNGDVLKLINIKTSIPEQESIRLTFKGKIIIPVELVPLNAWLGDVDAETKVVRGSVEIMNNTRNPLKIIEVIPPDDHITYALTTIEKNQKYRLDYLLYPPFEGSEKVEKQFIFKTNNKKNEYVYHKFFYYIK